MPRIPGGGALPSACWRKASSTAAMHASGVRRRSTSLREKSSVAAAPARELAKLETLPSLMHLLLPQRGTRSSAWDGNRLLGPGGLLGNPARLEPLDRPGTYNVRALYNKNVIVSTPKWMGHGSPPSIR